MEIFFKKHTTFAMDINHQAQFTLRWSGLENLHKYVY